jgi:copper transport protein
LNDDRMPITRFARTWLLVCLALLSVPRNASAHLHLLHSLPADSASLSEPPREIRLAFSQPVEPELSHITLFDAMGMPVPLSPVAASGTEGRELIASLRGALARGWYRVEWSTTGRDSHVVKGTLVFEVREGAAAALHQMDMHASHAAETSAEPRRDLFPNQPEPLSATWWSIALVTRWLGFIALIGMIGCAAFKTFVLPRARLADDVSAELEQRVWQIARIAAGLSMLTLFARLLLQSLAVHGRALALSLDRIYVLLSITPWGHAWVIQALATGLFFAGLALALRRSVGWSIVLGATLVLALVPAMSGHAAATERDALFVVLLDWLHVLSAGTWIGSLGVLLLAGLAVARREDVLPLVRAFSPVALGAASALVASGAARALYLFSDIGQLVSTDYGRMLCIKLGLLLVVAITGWYNWKVVTPSSQPRRALDGCVDPRPPSSPSHFSCCSLPRYWLRCRRRNAGDLRQDFFQPLVAFFLAGPRGGSARRDTFDLVVTIAPETHAVRHAHHHATVLQCHR